MSRKRVNKPWTEEDDALLVAMYASAPLDKMIEKLGRSANAIYTHAFQLRLNRLPKEPKPKQPKESKQPKQLKEPKPKQPKAKKPNERPFSSMEYSVMRELGSQLSRVELKMLLPRLSIIRIRELADRCNVDLPW